LTRRMYSLREIAPPAPAVTTPVGEKVWLLNLDQIEPHTGTLLSKEYVESSRLGTSTHSFDEGNVLYSKLRPYLNKVVLPDIAGYCTSELVPMRPNQAVVTREYLAAYLRSPSFLNWVSQQVDGAKMPRVSMKVFWEHRIELPSLDEQKRITSILAKADSLRRKRQEAIRLADELLRSAFYELFGDPVVNNKNWGEREIAEIGKVTTGNTPSRDVDAYFGDALEWIKSDNINTAGHWLTKAREGLSELGTTVARTAPRGSTLMTCIAGSPSCIGNVAMTDRTVAFNQQINAVTPLADIEPEFVYALLLFSKARIQAASTNSMKGMVSKGTLEKVRLIWPPVDLQKKFVQVFRQVQRLQSRMEAADASSLFNALQSKILT
jgi:type I restriction enzyme S subunit